MSCSSTADLPPSIALDASLTSPCDASRTSPCEVRLSGAAPTPPRHAILEKRSIAKRVSAAFMLSLTPRKASAESPHKLPHKIAEEASSRVSAEGSRRRQRGSQTPRAGKLAQKLGDRSAEATKQAKLSYESRSWRGTARTFFNLRQKKLFVMVPWLLLTALSAVAVVINELLMSHGVAGFEEGIEVPGQVPGHVRRYRSPPRLEPARPSVLPQLHRVQTPQCRQTQRSRLRPRAAAV